MLSYSDVRAHIIEVQLPSEPEEIRAMIRDIHQNLTDCILAHIDASGHKIYPVEDSDIIMGKKFMDVIGETGATYYLRRKYKPEKFPNWGRHNEEIMEAFYHKKSIKHGGTIMGTKCDPEWIADNAGAGDNK